MSYGNYVEVVEWLNKYVTLGNPSMCIKAGGTMPSGLGLTRTILLAGKCSDNGEKKGYWWKLRFENILLFIYI